MYRIETLGSRLVIPPAGLAPGAGVVVYSWGEMETRLNRWLHEQVASPATSKDGRRVLARLIPRPDNDHNPFAVSLAAEPSFGGDIEDRHLGFLPDRYLQALGFRTLHNLARRSGGELVVTITVGHGYGQLQMALDVPAPEVLRPVIERFMADSSHPPLDQLPQLLAGTPYFEGIQRPEDRVHDTLAALAVFEAPARTRKLEAAVDRYPLHGARTISIIDADSGEYRGRLTRGHLHLQDERERDVALALLREIGVAVAPPKPVHSAGTEGEYNGAADAPPNVWVQDLRGGPDFRPVSSDPELRQTTFAQFNPTTEILYVEDDRLVVPAAIHAARMGFEVRDVVTPSRPWNLDNEVWYSVRKDRTLGKSEHSLAHTELSRRVRNLVPRELFTGSTVSWTDGAPQEPSEDTQSFLAMDKLIRERRQLFGEHELGEVVAPCRLCGRAAIAFTSPMSIGKLSYCQVCLQNAQHGVVEDKQKAAMAVAELAAAEFFGMPMLEPQLARLNVSPNAPVPPEQVDRLLILRFGVKRGAHAWTHLLLASGVAEEGIRTSRGTLMRAIDGHLCRSMQEKAVDDFFHQYGIAHELEPTYPVHPSLNPNGRRRADWRLSDGTFVEMWGMPEDAAYAAKMRDKHQLAASSGMRLVGLTLRDLPRLPELFAEWATHSTPLPAAGSWAPARLRKAKAEPRGDNRGANAANTGARQERLARAALAVELQARAATRSSIACELGTTPEVVKMLLRDGKFYADPDIDPGRVELAFAAAAAKENGTTKGAFQLSNKLSVPKAQEAWRDADVLFGATAGAWRT